MPQRMFAARLGEAIAARQVSQADVARRLGVTPTAVSQWVRGDTVPEAATVFRLEEALELSPGALSTPLGFVPAPPPEEVVAAIQAAPDIDCALRVMLLDVVYLWDDPFCRRVLRDIAATLRDHRRDP